MSDVVEIIDPTVDASDYGNYATFELEDGTEYSTLDWDFFRCGIEVSDPEVRRYEVRVPGRDGALDLTEALGGRYFDDRTVTVRLRCVNGTEEKFHLLASTVRNAIEGRVCKIVLSADQGYFWKGRPTVDAEWKPLGASDVTISAKVAPYKYSVTSSYDPWLWDSFSFVDGVITDESDITLTGGTTSVSLPKDPARGKPTLWLNTGNARARLSTDPNWHTLKSGANLIPEIRQSADGTVTLMLNGTGSVGIEYRIGSL